MHPYLVSYNLGSAAADRLAADRVRTGERHLRVRGHRVAGLVHDDLRQPGDGLERGGGGEVELHPADLHARIRVRVDEMFALGLLAETRQLLELGLGQNKTAMQAIGYRQCIEHLRGERPLPETIALVKQKTWQFAKRQMTWFRNQFRADLTISEKYSERLLPAVKVKEGCVF